MSEPRKSKPGYEDTWWCCGANFGEHEADCPNYAGEPSPQPAQGSPCHDAHSFAEMAKCVSPLPPEPSGDTKGVWRSGMAIFIGSMPAPIHIAKNEEDAKMWMGAAQFALDEYANSSKSGEQKIIKEAAKAIGRQGELESDFWNWAADNQIDAAHRVPTGKSYLRVDEIAAAYARQREERWKQYLRHSETCAKSLSENYWRMCGNPPDTWICNCGLERLLRGE